MSSFTQKHNNPHRFRAVGGRGAGGGALYQQWDLQSLQPLEKLRIPIVQEK